MARRALYPLLLCLLVTGFFWKLWLTNEYTWLQAPDFANQLLPWYQFQASEWHAGRIPLWTPYEWAGQSLIGQGQPGVVDPLNLLLYAAPLSPNGWLRQTSLHWFFILAYMSAALAMYAFCRGALRVSQPAALLGALAYGLGGIPNSTAWPQMMHATIWGPLGLLFQFRAARESDKSIRNGALSGMFFGLMWLTGHHQIPFYFTLASAGLWMYFLYTRFATKPGILRAALASGLFLALFGAVQVLPMLEYGRSAIRFVNSQDPASWQDKVPYHVHREYSMHPLGLLNVMLRMFEQYEPYMGVTATVLAVLGVWTGWRQRGPVRWLSVLGIAAISYALGANSFLHGALYALLPMFEKARVPAVAMVLLNFAMAGLVAYGVDFAATAVAVRKRLAVICLTAACVLVVVLRVDHRFRIWTWIYAGAALALCAVALRWSPRRLAPALFGVAIVLELSNFAPSNWQNQKVGTHEPFLERLGSNSDLAIALQQMPGNHRVHSPVNETPNSFGDYWGVETIESFTASVPAALWNMDVFDDGLRDFVSVRYDITKKAFRDTQVERFRTASGLRVFENPGVFPRAWMVHRVETVAGPNAAKAWMKTRGPERLREAVVYDAVPAGLGSCDGSGDEIEWLLRIPNRLRLRVKAACPAMLIVNDSWDAGWRASVDGRSVKLWLADGFVRGVVVDAGTHEVEVVYRPATVIAGAICFLLGVLGIAVLGILRL